MTTCIVCGEVIHAEAYLSPTGNVIHPDGNCVSGDETDSLIWVHSNTNNAACQMQNPQYDYPTRYAQE